MIKIQPKVGDKVLIIKAPPSKWNGDSGEPIEIIGEIVSLDSEKARLRLVKGEEMEVPLVKIGRVVILETKESIFQKAREMEDHVIEAITTVIGFLAFGIFLLGLLIKEGVISLKNIFLQRKRK